MSTPRFAAITTAHAKLNLALQVLGLDACGYHAIRSVMISLELADSLSLEAEGSITRTPSVDLEVRGGGHDVPDDDRNLAVRALRLFYEEHGGPSTVRMRLRKRIPSQAGLGGGSADAAAVLRALGIPRGLSYDELGELGARLGSDIPFAIKGGAALVSGRGEHVQPFPVRGSWWVVLVQPVERISTAWCYRRWDELNPDMSRSTLATAPNTRPGCRLQDLQEGLEAGCLEDVVANLYNDLEHPVFDLHPHLQEIPRVLREGGCAGALMTGSGSCFFGLAHSRAIARTAAALTRARNLGWVHITRTRQETP